MNVITREKSKLGLIGIGYLGRPSLRNRALAARRAACTPGTGAADIDRSISLLGRIATLTVLAADVWKNKKLPFPAVEPVLCSDGHGQLQSRYHLSRFSPGPAFMRAPIPSKPVGAANTRNLSNKPDGAARQADTEPEKHCQSDPEPG